MHIMKPITEFPGYFVTRNGQVWSSRRAIFLKASFGRGGYAGISLSKSNVIKRVLIHRLVATYFTRNPDLNMQVNHIDGNKRNNKIENLEWCTPKRNMRHKVDVLGSGRGETHGQSKLKDAQVVKMREIHKSGKLEARDIAELCGLARSTVNEILRGDRWKHLIDPRDY